jgi:uncharacterized protein YbjT (DUF2867 family)
MSITVIGASGGIGSHVTALAGQRGHHVRADHQQAGPGAAPPVKAVVLLTGLAMTCVMTNAGPRPPPGRHARGR